ncbi:MAG: hypothetical protein QOH28_984 [Actinomycetota bacterium]|nr:hypothetical protein [Actinomycetota bacterium]
MVTTAGDAPVRDAPVGDAAAGERRLTQWMLDVGTPPARVFELLAEAAGIAHGARVSRGLDFAPRVPATEPRARELARLAS